MGVLTCPRCGQDNRQGARFCNACGAPLPAEPREVRKRVTVVFADLSGSTALGERLDPEVLRGVMRRYHAEQRAILERHGGTVEKFVGDAVMAVFGLPQVHDDDALRAVRAAAEMRDAVEALGLGVRIGINTGEVVAGEGETLVTGDAVNVAARLEQAAAPGEILIGEETHVLVRDAVRARRLEPLSLKGKSERVSALRLVEVLADVPAFTRPIATPFVGRDAELRKLEASFRQATDEWRCRLCTIVGPPGIGKSRLARELLGRVDAQVLVGRCLAYGEGITYWPLAEIVEQVPRGVAEIVEREENAEVIAARIGGAVGRVHGAGAAEEIAWAFRRLFEVLARERPLIVVVDDIHWAEPTLLDLLEYVVAFSAPSWSNPRPNMSLIALDPLSDREARDLTESLAATRRLPEELRARVIEAAEGNPLFVEQLVAMHAEQGDGEVEITPTIQALLAARIDRLEPREREVIERASVEGRLFHRGAVSALLPEVSRPALGSELMTLVRKEFIRPDRALFPGDDGFRFGHILIRDAAYGSVPKRLRADLHERYSEWLEQAAGEREIEFEEILGYHLEQAHRYRIEVDGDSEAARELGTRAARRLRRAGERAFDRGDSGAATNLCERAAALCFRDDPMWARILDLLGSVRMEAGELEGARQAFDEAIGTAVARGERRVYAHASVERARLLLMAGQVEPRQAQAEAERLIPLLDELGDARGLAKGWLLMYAVHEYDQDHVALMHAAEQALVHARAAGAGREEATARARVIGAALWGPEPAADVAARCEEVLSEARGPALEAHARITLGVVRALRGDVTEARPLYTRGRELFREVGLSLWAAGYTFPIGYAEFAAGELVRAEAELRRGADELEQMGQTGIRSSPIALLARIACLHGRDEEAEELVTESLAVSSDDELNQMICGGVRARITARRGDFDAASALIEEMLRHTVKATGLALVKPDAYMDLAEVMRLAGRHEEEAAALREALRLYEQKGNAASASTVRSLLEGVPGTRR